MSKTKTQNPDAILTCPYDPVHRIRGSVWHTHIIKCKKVNAEIAKDFEKCPFTGAHIIRKTEMLEHMKTCSARILLDTISSKNPEKRSSGDCSLPSYVKPTGEKTASNEEDWDDDMEKAESEMIRTSAKKSLNNNLKLLEKLKLNDDAEENPVKEANPKPSEKSTSKKDLKKSNSADEDSS